MVAFAQMPGGGGARMAVRSGQMIGVDYAVTASARSNDTARSGEARSIVLADAVSPSARPVPSHVIGDDPAIGNDTVSRDYLRAARADLIAGRTGEAQQSLELAQWRALDQAAVPGRTATPNTGVFIARIIDARRALEHGDSYYAVALIDVALMH